MTALRPYQAAMLDSVRAAIRSGKRAPLLVAPTGSGKTHCAAAMIEGALSRGNRVVFGAPRRELIYQLSQRLDAAGVRYGVIMAGEPAHSYAEVQIACIPTLHARAVQRKRLPLPPAELVLVDEAHLGIGGRTQEIIEQYRDGGSIVVGLSATPARTDGCGLGELYDCLVEGPSVAELTRMGHLVPARYFVGEKPDLSGIKIQAGDYHQGQLAERVDQPKLIGDIVENWARIAPDRQTFVFASNVAHSRHLCEQFKAAGVAAEHLDGSTPLDERLAIQDRVRRGETQVLCNVLVMSYGVDFPPVSCIVFASPTKSIVRYLQTVGRGLRPAPGKTDCCVLDHAGAVNNPDLGFVDDPRPWSLDGTEKLQERQEREKKPAKEIACPSCGVTFRASRRCPNCGHEMGAAYTKAMEVIEAELEEIGRDGKKSKQQMTTDEKRALYRELLYVARKRGYQDGWAAHAYRQKTGVWPRGVDGEPISPSDATLRWVRYLDIKRAKARPSSPLPKRDAA